MAHDFYEDLYKSENTIGIEEVMFHVPRKVTGEMNETLNAAYTEEEVKSALFQIFPSKASGRTGSLRIFFKSIGICVERSSHGLLFGFSMERILWRE
jgi:hypothetical protein